MRRYNISWLSADLTSADIARERLHGIVAADRESAPCWRFVANDPVLVLMMKWNVENGITEGYNIKPRYRWEQRR